MGASPHICSKRTIHDPPTARRGKYPRVMHLPWRIAVTNFPIGDSMKYFTLPACFSQSFSMLKKTFVFLRG